MDTFTGLPAADTNVGFTAQQIADARAAGITEGRTAGLADGRREGAEAERARLATIMNADGVKGNPLRLAAALELASESPDMAADKVVGFAVRNVPEQKPVEDKSLAARGSKPDSLGQAGVQPVNAGAAAWDKAIAKVNARIPN